jgi:hypothetical protein
VRLGRRIAGTGDVDGSGGTCVLLGGGVVVQAFRSAFCGGQHEIYCAVGRDRARGAEHGL